jgi:nicotinate dehydrogenase subunit A
VDQDFALIVDGVSHAVRCDPDTPLVHVLRNDLGRAGTRFGCGEGLCGVCMVLLDGHPAPSCSTPVWSAAGRDIVTVEGLGADGERLRSAFAAEQAAQCGYCLSGLLVSAAAHLRDGGGASDGGASLRDALDRHLCRCGTHPRILRAIERAAVPAVGTETAP